jgi:hypothetical protein
MNFRKSKFCSELNDHRLHPTLRVTFSFHSSHSPGVKGHPTSEIPVKSVMTFKAPLFGKLRRTFCLYQPVTAHFVTGAFPLCCGTNYNVVQSQTTLMR